MKFVKKRSDVIYGINVTNQLKKFFVILILVYIECVLSREISNFLRNLNIFHFAFLKCLILLFLGQYLSSGEDKSFISYSDV